MRTLKVFGTWLVEEGCAKSDLFARVKRPKTGEPVIEVLPDGEIKVLGRGKKERIVPFAEGTKRGLVRYVNTFRPPSNPRQPLLSAIPSPPGTSSTASSITFGPET